MYQKRFFHKSFQYFSLSFKNKSDPYSTLLRPPSTVCEANDPYRNHKPFTVKQVYENSINSVMIKK